MTLVSLVLLLILLSFARFRSSQIDPRLNQYAKRFLAPNIDFRGLKRNPAVRDGLPRHAVMRHSSSRMGLLSSVSTGLVSVHTGFYWMVLCIRLDEIVFDIFYVQQCPAKVHNTSIPYFFWWDSNDPVGSLGPVIYSHQNRSIGGFLK